jgi:TonB family protein
MISIFAALMLQAAAPPPAPPPPPQASSKRKSPARALTDMGSLIDNDDYPTEALRNDEQGTVAFRLDVSVDGRVAGCTVTRSSGSTSLDKTTCRLMTERARFTPARNRRGKPVTDRVAARIVWRIQESSADMPFAATLLVATMRVTPAGEATCSYALDAAAARTLPCPADVATQMGKNARRAGVAAEQTIVTIITPAGEAEPVDRGIHGTPFMYGEALLTVAADGSILECGVVRDVASSTSSHGFIRRSPCEDYAPGRRRFAPAAAAGPPRTVTVKTRGYYRF